VTLGVPGRIWVLGGCDPLKCGFMELAGVVVSGGCSKGWQRRNGIEELI